MKKNLLKSTFVILWFLVLMVLSPLTPLASSIPLPNNNFYVLDEVGVLSSSTIETILSTSRDLQAKTKAQIVVLIVSSMRGEDTETFSLNILRKWEIGDETLDNGLLILLAMEERVSRIEVGYGLEGILNDAKTGRFQDTYMLPYYTAGDYDQGILNGYLAFAQEVAKEYNVTLDSSRPVPFSETNQPFFGLPSWLVILGFVILALIFITLDIRFLDGILLRILFSILFSSTGSRGTFGGGGSGGGGGSSRKW